MAAPRGYVEVDPSTAPPEVRAAMGPDWYSRIAGPITRGTTATLKEIEPKGLQEFRLPLGPLGTISGKPEDVATTLIPQTKLGALLAGLSFVLPEIKGLSVVERLPILRKVLNTRIGRTAVMSAAAAIEQEMEGKSALGGAATGAEVGGVGEAISATGQRLMEGPEAARYTSAVGQTIREHFPWIRNALEDNALHTGGDFDRAFKSGKVMDRMTDLLNGVKKSVVRQTVGRLLPPSLRLGALVRDNPEEYADILQGRPLTFQNVDRFLSKVRQKAYSLRTGDPKDQALAARIRGNADQYLNEMTEWLNKQRPDLGTAYREAQKRWWEARNVSDLFSEPRPPVIDRGTLQPAELQRMARETDRAGYRRELEATLPGKRLLSQIFRGGEPARMDQPRFELPVSIHPGDLFGARPRAHMRIGLGTSRAGTVPQALYGGIPSFAAQAAIVPSEEEQQ